MEQFLGIQSLFKKFLFIKFILIFLNYGQLVFASDLIQDSFEKQKTSTLQYFLETLPLLKINSNEQPHFELDSADSDGTLISKEKYKDVKLADTQFLFKRHPFLLTSIRPVENYETILATLGPNQILKFPTGEVFEILSESMSGTKTKVFWVQPVGYQKGDYVLRLPLHFPTWMEKRTQTENNLDYLNWTIENANILAKAKVAPAMIQSRHSQFALMEGIHYLFSFDDLLESYFSNEEMQLSKEQLQLLFKLLDDFESFALKLAAFKFVGDIHSENIVYDGNQWWLLDHTNVELFDGKIYPIEIGKNPLHYFLTSAFFINPTLPLQKNKQHSLGLRLSELTKKIEDLTTSERLKYMINGVNPVSGDKMYWVSKDLLARGQQVELGIYQSRMEEIKLTLSSCRSLFAH